ncbi:K02A2.6-like [Cordylochernes scorpioides]|uniref:RNA-directed DNA polymerase n=1 Tax=Cordylochernes scorpioides TaxID=51811 RepID=A0ABY6KJ93_9ARAC|nr:K02A2.6-like [Cordylochernes scorpioides]
MPGHRKRRQFKQTDAFTRGMVIGLKRAGWSIRQIAADTHLGASTVHRLWKRWLEQGNVAIYRNAGTTRVTSARVDRRILRQAVAAPQATCTAILQHVQDTLDHSISTRTISRRLVANGLHSCRPLKRLRLTPPNRRQRLEWCRARSTWMTEWHRVVFSDESRFCLSSDSRRVRVWRRRGERSNPAAIVERPTVRQRGIMVWGAIAYDSRSPLLRIQGTMTAQRYVDDVLRPVTLPYLQGVPNALYQQDKTRPHTARISQQALQDVQMLPWPPYSPDLSPIEHVWDIIGRRLHALPQPRSEDELWQMVEREWRAIPQDAIRTLIDSLPRRVAACIAVRESQPELQPNITESRQDYHNEGDHNEEGKDCPDRKEPRSKMEEQTNPSNDTAEQTIPKQETTLEEEETSPPQDTSADPLTQIADALSKLLVARSPKEIDVSPYDGTFEAQSFFDNFDAQADRTELTYTDRLRKLPCYLQGKPLQYFRSLRLDRLYYIEARQRLIDLFPATTEASFARFLAIKMTPQMSLENYYQNKTVMGMKLDLPADILIESLTDGLPVADQRLVATVQPNTIKEWFDLVSRITQCATSAVNQRQVDKAPHPTYHNPPPRYNSQRPSRVTYPVTPPPLALQVLQCHALALPVCTTVPTGPNTPSLQRPTTHNHCTKTWYPHPAQGPTSEPCSPSPSCKPRRLCKPREQLNDFNNLQIYQNNDALPTNVYKFTKCKQDLCSTQPRETDMFTTFPSHQSCLHVADSTPIICSPPISPTHDIEISIPSNAAPQLEHCPHELHRILYEFSQVFSTNKYNVPKLNIPPVKINTTTDKIIALRPYRVPLHDQQEIQTQIEQMLQYGIIAPSVSPYASPITLVTKRDQTKRFCIDYRKLNEIIAPDVHPLPLIETILDKLSKAKYYSSVDIASAYWQVEIEPNSRNLLAFVTLDSQYEFCRLPYGFKNSPQIYHRAINQVMQKYKLNFVTHYFDDFIIFSDTLEDHLQHLQQFLTVCQHENIKLNYNKCSFFKTKIDFLGYTVTAGTYAPQTRNLDTINAIKTPNNQKTLQSFLGAVNVYNKFIADYARLRAPLNKLLKKDVKWNWNTDCQQAFTTLKESLTSKPVLHLYQVGLPCRLYCDASTQGIAGILKQVHPDGQIHPVQYFSRALRAHERNYTVSELECLAIVESVDKFRIYLTGIKFTIYTDHQALQWLKTIKNPSGRLFRWSLRLSTYNYEIHYIKGSQQYEADLLSRNPFVGFISTDIIKQHQPTASPFNIDTNGLHTITRKGVTKIIIPETLQHSLMNKVHQKYNHPGISQMTRIITTQYYWKGISKSIEKFVRSCHTCQIIKRPKGKPYGALGQIPPPQQPFDLISIDTIAGFSKYGHSKTYLHVIVDHLTRYAWTFPSKSTSTLTYIQTLKTVLQQGSPKRLLSDRAPAFTSEKFRKFLIMHGIQPLLTTSNNPQANGLIERLNATITGKLRLAYLENPKASWTQLVKRVTQTYNNTPHSVTSFPPTYLMFNVIPPDLRTHLNPYPEIKIAREIANSRTQNKHKKDKETFDKQHRTPHFEENDLVLVKNYRHPDTEASFRANKSSTELLSLPVSSPEEKGGGGGAVISSINNLGSADRADSTLLPRPKSRQDCGRQGTSKQVDHCLYRKMEQGREEDQKEPMETYTDYESGENTTFPKKETTLGRTQEIAPSQQDATPPPPVSDVLGRLTRTLHQLSAVTGLSRDVKLPRYDGSYEAQSFFTNYDAQADRAQLQYSTRLRKPPNLLQVPLRVTNTRAHVTRSPDPLYTTSPAQAVNSDCPKDPPTMAPNQDCPDIQDSTTVGSSLHNFC